MDSSPLVAVVVSTRDRGDRVVSTVRDVLSDDHSNLELVVVDQSEDDRTEQALIPLLGDPRLQYVRSATKGLASSRNVGIEHAHSELIGMTDDDCELPAGWLSRLVEAFGIDERIGLVFGNVLPAAHDPTAGFVPSHVSDAPALARDISEKNKIQGVGACMGMRRDLWQRLGGFDSMLGVGAPWRAGEEVDLTIRALLAGYQVYQTSAWAVVHHGVYAWGEGRALITGYWLGTGAAFGKNFKRNPIPITGLLLELAPRWMLGRSPVAASLGDSSYRWLRLRSFARGFVAALLAPANRAGAEEAARSRDLLIKQSISSPIGSDSRSSSEGRTLDEGNGG